MKGSLSQISLMCCLAAAQAFQVPIKPNRLGTRLASSNPDPASELTSTLARLDQQWKIQQRSSKTKSRWTSLQLDKEDSNSMVYLLEPPNQSVPSCIITFVGGAGLGSYPQIAYNELLLRISDRLNAAVVAAPYQVGLDHFSLAQETGERARQALEYCQDDPGYLYPVSLPVYSLSHSLGGKLTAIHMAATNQDYAGVGMISFNNFGFGQTIGMAKEFAEEIRTSIQGMPNIDPQLLDTVFSFAETAVSAIGIDFSPTTEQMERLINLKYDTEKQAKTRLITFDNDKLQSTREFVNACEGQGPDVSELPGTHLTPVFFELGLDQIPDVEAQNMAKEAMGGFEKASFGSEEELSQLVDEVCSWILGKEPPRRPDWQREPPQIAAATTEESS